MESSSPLTPQQYFDRYFYVMKFFTMWTIILVVFHRFTHQYLNLLYLSFAMCIMALYISFTHQKYIMWFNNRAYEATTYTKSIIDVLMHILVFLFVLTLYRKYYKPDQVLDLKMINSLLIITIYAVSFNIDRIYGHHSLGIFVVFIVSIPLYYSIFG